MYPMIEHPDITRALRTGYPSLEEDEVLNDEDDEYDYDSEFWGDECEDRAYEEARERELFD